MHHICWRWHEDGVLESASAYPHWAGSQLSWAPVLPTESGEQQPVEFSEEPDRDREALAYPLQAVFHCDDVVADFPGIIRFGSRGRLTGLEAKELTDIGLRTLDARAEHGLQSQVRPDEQVGVGDQPSQAAKTMDGTRRLV